MSDQKPVKRDAAWLAAVNALITEHGMAVISFHQKQIPAEAMFAKRQAIDAMLVAPDPRDACVEALRLARAALDVSTTHRPEDREKVVAARIATENTLRALDGEQIEALQKVKAAIAKATGAEQ